ncbi:MAG: helix-turn-helix domain-containing protein [Desulfobulbaceae bacterium]|nr:helix-turn-helix domain-containing protein [Desulfobulbaceae bacterium]
MDRSFYTIRTIAEKLGVSEKTIYRMLNDNQIPCAVKIGGQWRFRADAIDGWLNARTNREAGTGKADTAISVHDALEQGMVMYRIHGRNRDESINELLASLPYMTEIDHQALKVSIFTRESLASSSMQGIASMGISDERPLYFPKSMILLAFLERPADFKALDGVATEAFFLVLPANRVEQGILEMRLARLCQDDEFRHQIKKQRPRRGILELIRSMEEQIFVSRGKSGKKTTGEKLLPEHNANTLPGHANDA